MVPFITFFFFISFLYGCDRQLNSDAQPSNGAAVKTGENGKVIAEINGKPIYETELNMLMYKMFGAYQASQLNEDSRKKALTSILASREIADKARKELNSETKALINYKVKFFEENLLINEYVRTKPLPSPVTSDMINQYYNENLELFGKTKLRYYQMVSTKQSLPVDLRDKFLADYGKLKNKKDIKAVHKAMEKKGYSLQYHKGILNDELFSKKVNDFIRSQAIKKLSNIAFIDDKAYLVYVDKEAEKSAKPLASVSKKIRKTLAVAQLKKAIKQLSETTLKESKVVYYD